MSSWQAPLAKLVALIILLPFSATYFHLYYYTYWKNEHCFVGPHTSMISGKPFGTLTFSSELVDSAIEGAAAGNAADNEIRGETAAVSGIDQFHGMYAPTTPKQKKKKGQNNVDKRQFQQIYSTSTSSGTNKPSPLSWFGNRGWPSITRSSIMITSPSSKLSNHQKRHGQDMTRNADHVITFVEAKEEKKWCLQSLSENDEKWCSDSLPDYPDGTIYAYPPSGVWKSTSTTTAAPSLVMSCPTPATSTPTQNKKSRHKGQNNKQNQNVQFILNHPATTLLLLLNTGLAFYYWNYRISPSSVSKQYTKIVLEHEWWRGFTGATAHFEPLHIGFNMMSLHTLGRELERGFGSIVFLVYNFALVVFTTLVMMGMVYARIKWIQHKLNDQTINPQLEQTYQEQQQRLRETSTVGYSAVLFAWMVVSTMERKEATCPVPFFNDVCFSTYQVPGMPFLKFNVAPIVSLFVAQFIMPRVSFMGHLAGIVCGFCLHWGWAIPPLEICSSNVLISLVFLAGLIWKRRIIPVRPLLTAMLDEEGCVEHEEYLQSLLLEEAGDAAEEQQINGNSHHGNGLTTTATTTTTDPFVRGKQKKKEREQNEARRKQKTLLFLRNAIGAVALASLFVFDWSSSLVLSQCILLAYFTFATQASFIVWAYTRSKVENDIIDPEKGRAGVIWRGVFISVILSVVVDSMSVASWSVFPTFISAERHLSLPIGLFPAVLFMILRTVVNLFALVISSKILHDLGQVGTGSGIFYNIFANQISWSKQIGDHGIFISQRPMWTAFEGRGITLGRRR